MTRISFDESDGGAKRPPTLTASIVWALGIFAAMFGVTAVVAYDPSLIRVLFVIVIFVLVVGFIHSLRRQR